MKCIDCGDTGWIPLYTSVSECTSCDISTINQYIIGELRKPNEDPHYPEMEPFVQAVQAKTSRALRLLINDTIYATVLKDSQNLLIHPRDDSVQAWAYTIHAYDLHITRIDSTVIDNDDYVVLEIIHVDKHEEL